MRQIRRACLACYVAPAGIALLTLFGCAAGGPPPSASAIPWDPNLITQSRQSVADQWAADLARRNFVAQYMNAICAPDGAWNSMNEVWGKQLKAEWNDVLWHFQPIPNAPSAASSVDWGRLVEALVGTAIRVAPLVAVAPKTALPQGLPPC